MSVAPRWKRRADEIAEAIGDELSVNGTVSIGNDVNLSVATITALANAITNVLNPLSIAASVWGVQGDYGVCRAIQDPSDQNYWMVYSNIGHQVSHIHYANGTQISPSVNLQHWVYFNNNQWQLFDGDVVRNVSVLSTNTTPVHVQVRNVAGGFTAMGSDISTSMKLSAQPVSVADTVNVKTTTGEAVAITGTVNANVGGVTVPISNPNNITVPVVNTNSVTVPVSLGSVTVPVKATAAGIPQNANGISLYLPVDANHGLTIPVGGGVTSIPVSVGSSTVPVRVVTNTSQGASTFGTGVVVPVSGGIASVPVSNTTGVTVQISGGTSSVPVANTNSVVVPVRTVTGTTNAADGTGAAVVVPVTASGTVLDVKLVEVATAALPLNVNISTVAAAAKTQFHEAMETALEEADVVDVNIATIAASAKTQFHEAMETALEEADVVDVNIATIATAAQTDISEALGADTRGIVSSFTSGNIVLLLDNGDSYNSLKASYPLGWEDLRIGDAVVAASSGFYRVVNTVKTIAGDRNGVVSWVNRISTTNQNSWVIVTDNGDEVNDQAIRQNGLTQYPTSSAYGSFVSRRVSKSSASTTDVMWSIITDSY